MVWAAARRLHAAFKISIAFGSSAGRVGVAGGGGFFAAGFCAAGLLAACGGVCAFPLPASAPHAKSNVPKLQRNRVRQMSKGCFIRMQLRIRLGENPRFSFVTTSDPFRMTDGEAPTQGTRLVRSIPK